MFRILLAFHNQKILSMILKSLFSDWKVGWLRENLLIGMSSER